MCEVPRVGETLGSPGNALVAIGLSETLATDDLRQRDRANRSLMHSANGEVSIS